MNKNTIELQRLVKEIATKIPEHNVINQKVSKSNVGWHIEHVLLATNESLDPLSKPSKQKYKWKFNFNRLVVFTLKWIPRGSAKSPKLVLPDIYTEASLKQHVEITASKINNLNNLSTDSFLRHHVFGDLKLEKAITFLIIHLKHHLDIINDILKK